MTRAELIRLFVAGSIAAAFIATGTARLPLPAEQTQLPIEHPPVVVYSDLMLSPLIVRATHIVTPTAHRRKPFDRAPNGKEIRVSLTQYCLQGTTRRDNYVRPGIVAADPRVFPLARYVELFLGKHYLGRYLVDDTGKDIKGSHLDIWTPSCSEARRFGRRSGTAMLVARGSSSEHTGSTP